jgi:hypothetical protein
MTKHGGKIQREARKLQKATGVRYTEALARVQRDAPPVGRCPVCGSYDLETEHGGGGQHRLVCNACTWGES